MFSKLLFNDIFEFSRKKIIASSNLKLFLNKYFSELKTKKPLSQKVCLKKKHLVFKCLQLKKLFFYPKFGKKCKKGKINSYLKTLSRN
jgi:hypothetical protein